MCSDISAKFTGNVIRTLRKQKGYSQIKLSQMCGLPVEHIRKCENGLRMFTLTECFLFADALEIKPHEIVQLIEDDAQRELTYFSLLRKMIVCSILTT